MDNSSIQVSYLELGTIYHSVTISLGFNGSLNNIFYAGALKPGFIKRFGCVEYLLSYARIAEDVDLLGKEKVSIFIITVSLSLSYSLCSLKICQKYNDEIPSLIENIRKRSWNWKTAGTEIAIEGFSLH